MSTSGPPNAIGVITSYKRKLSVIFIQPYAKLSILTLLLLSIFEVLETILTPPGFEDGYVAQIKLFNTPIQNDTYL
jgi:hypothetical protein